MTSVEIGAVVLAAGQSRRMGRPKQVLPWGSKTVIAHVVEVLTWALVDPIVVVTGGSHQEVERALLGTPAQPVFNAHFMNAEMGSSLKTGLVALPQRTEAVLVVLGDQPQLELIVVRGLVDLYQDSRACLILPSYHNRRGHPWLVGRSMWSELIRESDSGLCGIF